MSFLENDRDLPEIPLTGGQITGGVVRVGRTVRRPRSEASGFVAELLGMLRERRFEGAPEYLGVDSKGRDCFSHVEGMVEPKWRHWPDEVVVAFGKLLRAFHDATRGTALAGEGEVVCHHDAGPHNVVFRDGVPEVLIDFDMVAPGDGMEDLAYAAWAWCVSSNPARPGVEVQAAQVRLLVEACGLDETRRGDVVEAVIERIGKNVVFWEERMSGGADRDQCVKMIDWSLREMDFVKGNAAIFMDAIRR